MTEINYQLLAQELLNQSSGMALKHTAPSSTPTGTYGHGNGGLFSYPGMSRPVFSAMSLPRIGLQSRLPVRTSNEQNPLYGIFTGVTATTGSEPNGVCDEPPVVGLSKLCTHSFVWGRMSRKTRVFDIDRSGMVTNRGEFLDLQFLGQPFQGQNPNVPTTPAPGNVLNNEIAKQMFEFGVGWARDFARDLYTGNPASNTAGGGRTYYYGLDMLINTGYQDAITGQLCPAADAMVKSFGSLDITTGTNGQTLVKVITSMYRNLRYIASTTGLDPVKWVLVMPWSMFYEVSAIWPCAYQTYRCQTTGTNDRTNLDRVYLNEMTDGMRGDINARTGQYLLIDGERVEVILDDAVTETVLPGESFTAPIYFVPMTVLGGTPVTFLEAKNYDMPGGAMDMARAMAPEGMYYTSDGGRFLWHKKPPTNFCVELLAKTEPRLLLLTPQLSARLTSVKYTPLAHERSWDPASSYYVNGGRTDYVGYGPSFNSPTQ